MSIYNPPIWHKPDGTPLACVEKIKILNENINELHQLAQDALDDAILMGGTSMQVKNALHNLIESLSSRYLEQSN